MPHWRRRRGCIGDLAPQPREPLFCWSGASRFDRLARNPRRPMQGSEGAPRPRRRRRRSRRLRRRIPVWQGRLPRWPHNRRPSTASRRSPTIRRRGAAVSSDHRRYPPPGFPHNLHRPSATSVRNVVWPACLHAVKCRVNRQTTRRTSSPAKRLTRHWFSHAQ